MTFYHKNFNFQFGEDRIYRHLEPALAFQLEMTRMSNFKLEAVPVANRIMNVYLGQAKTQKGLADTRLFVRTIIRHSDFIKQEASFEYFENEGERRLMEALDALEVALSHPSVCQQFHIKTSYQHYIHCEIF